MYYNLYTRGARPGRVVCLWCSCEYVGWALARLAPPSGRAASRAWSRVPAAWAGDDVWPSLVCVVVCWVALRSPARKHTCLHHTQAR